MGGHAPDRDEEPFDVPELVAVMLIHHQDAGFGCCCCCCLCGLSGDWTSFK